MAPTAQAIAAAARELMETRDSWLNPPDAPKAVLREHTLTQLYNADPDWLRNLHKPLDHAVLDAYGWPRDVRDEEILERLLRLNQKRVTVLHTQPVIQRAFTDSDALAPTDDPDSDVDVSAHLSDAG